MDPSILADPNIPPLEAVDRLSQTLEEFELNPRADPIISYSQASSALYEINNLARVFELLEYSPERIIEIFARIRRIMASSPLGYHMQNWPSGYHGDFEAVEYIASGINRAERGTLAFNLEQAILHSGIVQQHRYKLRRQSEAFSRALIHHGLKPRMLSLGYGGCRDLLPLMKALTQFEGELILNDIDPAALSFAGKRLSPATTRFQPLRANVLSAIRILRHDKRFDLVVAGGLFDYIPDRLLTLVLETVYHQLLASGGQFFFTNIAQGNLFRPLMSYAVNWQLIERSEMDIRNLCLDSSIPESCIDIERDESQLTWIVKVDKP